MLTSNNSNHNFDLVILYALCAILGLIASFMNYAEGRIPMMIVWFIYSILNIILGYIHCKR